jgi:RimJ/RimL family protein N-acetyltransferase
MIYTNELPVGTLRLDQQQNNEYQISILIDPANQGKGLALKALNQLPTLIENGLFIAYVDKDNISSQNVFNKAGFSAISTTRYCLKIKAHKKNFV